MIGAGLLGRLWARGDGPTGPDPAPAVPTSPFGSALVELRYALACFDLVDRVVRTSAENSSPGEDERRALAFAEWSLVRAMERTERAYRVAVGTGCAT